MGSSGDVHNESRASANVVIQAGAIGGGVHLHGANPVGSLTARPISRWGPLQLDVHRAIVVGGDLPELPGYLRREHDDRIDEYLAELDGAQMLVITGESSTGKTRALYEAVHRHEVLREWPLVYPRTADELLALLGGGVASRTVIWLNESQNHLSGPHGEQVAAHLRELLIRPKPVVVLGTLWPRYWDEFTGAPDGLDGRSQVRALLQHGVRRVRVADRFSPEQIALVGADRTADPRLAAAVSASPDRRVIQTIAGGPALVERHEHPETPRDRYAAAIVTAALDARRLGHQVPVSRALLGDAAPGYLGAEDLVDTPDDWFAEGLARAAGQAAHGITALVPRRREAGPGPADAYEPHDYLDQHGRRTRRDAVVPATLWQACAEHALDPEDRARLAESAYRRLVFRYGDRLCGQAIEAMATGTQHRMVATLAGYGRVELAMEVVRTIPRPLPEEVQSGLFDTTVRQLGEQGRYAEAEHLVRALIDSFGDDLRAPSVVDWVRMLARAKGPDTAADLVRRVANRRYAEVGQEDQAIRGEQLVLAERFGEVLATVLAENDRWPEALTVVRKALGGRAGPWLTDEWAEQWLAHQLAASGNLQRLHELAAADSPTAALLLAERECDQGDEDAVNRYLSDMMSRPALDARPFELLIGRGEVDKAVQLLHRHGSEPQQVERPAWDRSMTPFEAELVALADTLASHGYTERAITMLTEYVGTDGADASHNVVRALADRLAEADRWAEALTLVRRNRHWMRDWLPRQLARSGNLTKLRALADEEPRYARQILVDALLERGEITAALAALREYAERGDYPARERLARVLADHGCVTELRERTAAGDGAAAQWLLALARAGRVPDGQALLEHGLTPDGAVATNP
ncbi:hypothetical protein [Amycolatopsis aidingensis]|uniref:hypothetical protein n=1 Tax=Amycolatopsis aidingensis TaxID=2842453 RepID=UPI001C0C779F|nr:hypothetical protein [Amycolatopsis aidingensis]